ncbi:endonuclease domain-containing protein [Sphingobium olei]|uniref:Endonuclease domain-containing protein n=1 Tax=Sphingobium olei TaxID=420955 RepID=A0ABW3P917_9SPHN|nr:endonuclease domain-containing protein [Sphingobium sp.]
MDKGYARPTMKARALRNNATDAERALWQAISARKVRGIRFNRQVPIGPFICDFVARSIGLVIEVDGSQHGEEVDRQRTSYIEAQGFRVIRFWNHDVLGNIEGVIDEIERVIANMPSPNPSRRREGSFLRDQP